MSLVHDSPHWPTRTIAAMVVGGAAFALLTFLPNPQDVLSLEIRLLISGVLALLVLLLGRYMIELLADFSWWF